ncbi:MAG: M23 family metallopeptidase [Syntrophothermus sp.]
MRWERTIRKTSFSVLIFLGINALNTVDLPPAKLVRNYVSFVLTTGYNYSDMLSQAQSLGTFSGKVDWKTVWQRIRTGRNPDANGSDAAGPDAANGVGEDQGGEGTGGGSNGTTGRNTEEDRSEAVPGDKPTLASAATLDGLTAGKDPVRLTHSARSDDLRPVMPVAGRLSDGFGMRLHPIKKRPAVHEGLDIIAPVGTPVKAALDGKTVEVYVSPSFGKVVVLEHSNGFRTLYAHLQMALVRPGQPVKKGQIIAKVGNTGASTGAHLHLELWKDGVAVDPLPWFAGNL